MNIHEQTLVAAFVVPEKRARYAEFLARPGRRGEILDRLNHFFDFVPEFSTRVPRGDSGQLAALLRRRGAPARAYLVSDSAGLDGSELPLAEAIDRALADGWGTVVSCVPGRLALYLQEFPPGDAYLLAARAA